MVKSPKSIDIRKLRIGDEIDLPLHPNITDPPHSVGRVVYIHPQKRFFTLEFTSKAGEKIRESYVPHGPLGCTESKGAKS